MTRRTRLLVDARKIGDFGIGRAIAGLLGGLAELPDEPLEILALVRPGDEARLAAGVAPVACDAPSYSLSELVLVRAAIGRVKPDVFHAPHYVVPLFPPRATVVTVHDLMHLTRPEHAGAAKRTYARVMLRRAVLCAARVVTPSEATRRELAAFDARAASKTVVVPNGVGAPFTNAVPGDERARARAAHGLERPYLLFAGNDKPHKNLDGLLAAYARLVERDGAPDLVLAGGAPERAASRAAAAARLGIAPARLHDLGVVSDADLVALMTEADALVLPSHAEGFGLPVLEAQACGTPVVSSNAGGLPEAAGDAALLFDPAAPGALLEALVSVTSDEALRRDLRARGLARAARSGWDENARRMAGVYREAMTGVRSSSTRSAAR